MDFEIIDFERCDEQALARYSQPISAISKCVADYRPDKPLYVLKAYAVASGPVSILAGDRVNTAPGHRMWEVPDLEG